MKKLLIGIVGGNALPVLGILLVLASLFAAAAQAQTQPCPPCCQLGDINDDGILTAGDLSELQQHLLDLECTDLACRGDVDGDGEVTESDRDLIQAYILGLIDTFPRCGDIDGDGVLEWGSGGDDASCFRLIRKAINLGGPLPDRCSLNVVDANQDGLLDDQDLYAFVDLASGQDPNPEICACYEPFTP